MLHKPFHISPVFFHGMAVCTACRSKTYTKTAQDKQGLKYRLMNIGANNSSHAPSSGAATALQAKACSCLRDCSYIHLLLPSRYPMVETPSNPNTKCVSTQSRARSQFQGPHKRTVHPENDPTFVRLVVFLLLLLFLKQFGNLLISSAFRTQE